MLRPNTLAASLVKGPEDVGGVSGFERFLEIIADRDDPEYAGPFGGAVAILIRNGSTFRRRQGSQQCSVLERQTGLVSTKAEIREGSSVLKRIKLATNLFHDR
jgi:hypothetical protein